MTIALQQESCYDFVEDSGHLYFYGKRMDGFDEDQAVAAWLSEKFDLSQSEATLNNYRSVMARFRAFLAGRGLRLDPWHGLESSAGDQVRRRTLGVFAVNIRAFTEQAAGGKAVAPSTYNARLKVISSFYQFCNRYDLLFCGNPVDRIKRPRIKPYEHSRALPIEDVAAAMSSIDRSTAKGCRDYALLAVLLESGRRISEVLGLQWRDLTSRADGSLEVFFSRTKGGGTKRDLLSIETSEAVLSWVRLSYRGKTPKKTAWIWTSLSPRSRGQHRQLGYEACRAIMLAYLGTTSVHRARHTWVAAMRRLKAGIEEIQAGLGHGSAETTKIYDRHVREVDNPRRQALAQLFGITKSQSASDGEAEA